jgi:hypothetical protein
MSNDKQVNILVIVPGIIPSITIGILLPLSELERQGKVKFRVVHSGLYNFLANRFMLWADVVIFSRNCELHDLDYLYLANKLKKPVIYEIDDDFFNIQLNTRQGQYHRHYKRLHVVKRFFEQSSLVRVYSTSLYAIAKKYAASVELKKLYFYNDILKNVSRGSSGDVIKIAYPTTRIDESKLESLIYSALKMVLRKYGNKVELHLWKEKVPALLKGEPNIRLHPSEPSYASFIKNFYSATYEIGLAPIIEHPFYYAKTNNKYREFAGCCVPAVYTNALPYTSCVIDRENGLLAANTVQDWVDKISDLIENPSLRNKIIENSSRDIQTNYKFDDFVKVWAGDIHNAIENADSIKEFKDSECVVSEILCCFGSVDERFESLNQVANLLKIRLTSANWINPSFIFERESPVVVFIIDNVSQLKIAAETCGAFELAIIDITKFHGDFDEAAVNDLNELMNSASVRILYNPDVSGQFGLFLDKPTRCLPVDLSAINMFSLESYCGVYLNLLEGLCSRAKDTFPQSCSVIKRVYGFMIRAIKKVERIVISAKWYIGLHF